MDKTCADRVSDIVLEDLSVTFPVPGGTSQVLRHVSYTFSHEKITALVGESGSGKSILGGAVMGLLPQTAVITGAIRFDGRNLASSETDFASVRGKRIGWISQEPVSALDPRIPVGRQLIEYLLESGRLDEPHWKEAADRQLEKFGLLPAERVRTSFPHALSGGMVQRVLTAMVTLPEPEWIIADEPTKGLDAFVRKQAAENFRRLAKQGTGFILITHDLQLAAHLADNVLILYAGEVVEKGPASVVMQRPAHPYTQGLLRAQPSQGMEPIRGVPPDMSRISEGCVFANRCPIADKMCRAPHPETWHVTKSGSETTCRKTGG